MQRHRSVTILRHPVLRRAGIFSWWIWIFLLLFATLLSPLAANADSSDIEQLQQRIDELSAEAERTTDLNRLMAISQEMMELANQMAAELPGTEAPVPMQRAATPEAEVERQLQAINRAYRDGRKALGAHVGESQKLVPLAKAARLKGKIQVRGHFIAPKENDWIPLRLSYIVNESFVGFVTVTDYFDLSSGELSNKKDYYITSISTGITSSGSGRECVERSYYSPPSCTKWEQFAVSDISSGEVYPEFYAEVVRGAPESGGVRIEAIAPSIVFRSTNGRASESLGCFSSKTTLNNATFAASLRDGKFHDTQHVGREFQGTPGCSQGSQIEVSMELCDPAAFSEMDHCGAIEALLGEMEFILAVRDAFEKAINRKPQKKAKDLKELFEIAGGELSQVYPRSGSLKERYLDKSTGGYAVCYKTKIVPDQCKTSCAPSPLCGWQTEALDAHESAHHDDVVTNAHYYNVSCDKDYRRDNYPSDAAANRAEAQAWGEMEVNAYNEQAQVMGEIIQRELNLSSGCLFEASFYSRLQAANSRIQ